jgi:hypothetical protein
VKVLFEKDAYSVLAERLAQLRTEVESENRDRFLNLNETQYVEYLVARYRFDPIVFNWDGLTAEPIEKEIPRANFPPNFFFEDRSGTAKKQAFRIRIPYTGDEMLLRCRPSTHRVWSFDVQDERTPRGGVIFLDLINWSDEPEQIKRSVDEVRTNLQHNEGRLRAEIEGFNASLESASRQIFDARKTRLLRDAEVAAAIGIPLHRSGEVPATFQVPVIPKRLIVKPTSTSERYRPEPAISDSDYEQILSILSETGVGMERMPSTFSDKDEEALRDFFLMVLSTHYPNATGETFNKEGKTDILVRHEKRNVFVAECKFWNGRKSLLGAIDQLLGYLTWRDSKAAVICFIRSRDLQATFEKVPSAALEHPSVIRRLSDRGPGSFRFEAHMKGDPSRPVHLAILCFHFPTGGNEGDGG